MNISTIGFIGSGRVARIILKGFKRSGIVFPSVIASDKDTDNLRKLKEFIPEVFTVENDNTQPASQDIVFMGLHPPVMLEVLKEIQPYLKLHTILISLAPKLTIAKLSEAAGGFMRIVRTIPNAPSIINKGYNPIAFSKMFTDNEKKQIITWFSALGDCPEVDEAKLEAYAILTAMGPTYLWFQLYELQEISKTFGLSAAEVQSGITKMMEGAVATMYKSGFTPDEVMDLIPVKPLETEEEYIKNAYKEKLEALYKILKG